jgi:hypothetical protein
MLIARAKATAHLFAHGNMFRGHRACRMYRYFGFDTMAVFCSCGKVFGTHFTKPGDSAMFVHHKQLVTK